MLVKPGGRLSFTGVELAQLADVYSYSFKADQPYINQAVGYVLWPSISLSPNATVRSPFCCCSAPHIDVFAAGLSSKLLLQLRLACTVELNM